MRRLTAVIAVLVLSLFAVWAFPQAASAQTELITNGSFSSGASGWDKVGDFWAGSGAEFNKYNSPPGYAAGGVNSVGSPKNSSYGYLKQSKKIPSDATSATFSFYYRISTDDLSGTPHDYFWVSITSSGRNLGSANLSNTNQTAGNYRSESFDLSDVASLRGQEITVVFYAYTDATSHTVFRIDDVSLMVQQAAAPLPQPPSTPIAAVMQSPPPNSTLTDTSQIFRWSNAGASEYMILIGYVQRFPNENEYEMPWRGTGTEATIHGLSSNGRMFKLRLLSNINGNWLENEYTYTSSNVSTGTTPSPSLLYILIDGPPSVAAGGSATYTATATYSNGSTKQVTPAWSVSPGQYAYSSSVSSSGVLTLTARSPSTSQKETVTASYTEGGVTASRWQDVTISAQNPPGGFANPVVPNGKLGEFRHGTYPSLGNNTHAGVDIIASCGSDIFALADGTVKEVINNTQNRHYGTLGYMTLIEHLALLPSNKPFYTLSLHMQSPPSVKIGDSVIGGKTKIGKIGNTGNASGCHTHFEIRYFPELFSPEWKNIYGTGDQRSLTYFKTNWEDPETVFAKFPTGINAVTGSVTGSFVGDGSDYSSFSIELHATRETTICGVKDLYLGSFSNSSKAKVVTGSFETTGFTLECVPKQFFKWKGDCPGGFFLTITPQPNNNDKLDVKVLSALSKCEGKAPRRSFTMSRKK